MPNVPKNTHHRITLASSYPTKKLFFSLHPQKKTIRPISKKKPDFCVSPRSQVPESIPMPPTAHRPTCARELAWRIVVRAAAPDAPVGGRRPFEHAARARPRVVWFGLVWCL